MMPVLNLNNLRIKQERIPSPAPSGLSMKSNKSMGHPIQFNRDTWTPALKRIKQERMVPDAFSCLLMTNKLTSPEFKRDTGTPDLSSSLLTEGHFRCSVCSEVLTDPVSIPCGHSYCRQCISTYWAHPGPAGDFVCPQCCKRSRTRPELYTNQALATVVQELQRAGFSPAFPALVYAGPGDVACDVCSGKKLRAVKSCLTCTASYCESHIRQHYTVPALQRHTLAEVTGDGGHDDYSGITGKRERIKDEGETEDDDKKNVCKKIKIEEEVVDIVEAKRRICELHQNTLELKNILKDLKQENSGLKKISKDLEQENVELKNISKDLELENFGLKKISKDLEQENFGLKRISYLDHMVFCSCQQQNICRSCLDLKQENSNLKHQTNMLSKEVAESTINAILIHIRTAELISKLTDAKTR